MSKIPTVEQIWFSNTGNNINQEEYSAMIEFAKLHVKAALEAANEKAETKTEEVYAGSLGNEKGELYDKIKIIDKISITNTFDEIYKKFEL